MLPLLLWRLEEFIGIVVQMFRPVDVRREDGCRDELDNSFLCLDFPGVVRDLLVVVQVHPQRHRPDHLLILQPVHELGPVL